MTTEVVAMNRIAVALAADSAASLASSGRVIKVNNNADKLFQLSDSVGLMIFANSEFMEMPFEPIIKSFRNSENLNSKVSLTEYADSFFAYLEKLTLDDKLAINTITRLAFPLVNKAVAHAIEEIDRFVFERGTVSLRRNQKIFEEAIKKFNSYLDDEITYLESKNDNIIISDLINESILKKENVNNFVEGILEQDTRLKLFIEEDKEGFSAKLYVYLLLHMKKNAYSGVMTGIAFAGYGKNEMFPSLLVYHTEGIIGGKVKRTLIEEHSISSSGKKAQIVELAQGDIVKRYVEGIDPDFKDDLKIAVSDAFKNFSKAVFLTQKGKKSSEGFLLEVSQRAAEKLFSGFVDKYIEKTREVVLDSMSFMSKKDIAQLAEALVEMTALNRRVSHDAETVGGPVDVAVISKGDGFVWIKRKHYFDPDINPRYFAAMKAKIHSRENEK